MLRQRTLGTLRSPGKISRSGVNNRLLSDAPALALRFAAKPDVSTSCPTTVVYIIRKPSLDQRLIRHVPLVGFDLDPIKQSFRQPE